MSASADPAARSIVTRGLTTWTVDPAGETISLGFEGADGAPATVVVPASCVSALLMTLPRIAAQSLRARYRDPSLRWVHALGDWEVERAPEHAAYILTFRTPDGFEVSFALSPEEAGTLSRSLESVEASPPHRLHG